MRVSKRTAVVALAVSLSATGLASCADKKSPGGASSGGNDITLTLTDQRANTFIPMFLAKRLGFFKKEGLNVNIQDMKERSQALNTVLSGQAQGTAGFYDHNLDMQAKGKDMESMFQLVRTPGKAAVSRTDSGVDSAKDWGGKNIAVASKTGAVSHLAKYVAIHNGVPASKTKQTAVPDGPQKIAAFENKDVDAGIVSEPNLSQLQSKHLAKLTGDMRTPAETKATLGGPYPGTCLSVKTSWANSHKKQAQGLANGLYKALRWMHTHSVKQIVSKVPADFYKGSGKKQYSEALANQMGMYSTDGQMPSDGPQSVRRILGATDPVVGKKKIDVSKTYTDEFARNAAKNAEK